MSKITQTIPALPQVAGRYDNDFIQTADEFLNQLPNWSGYLNNWASQANHVRDEINGFKDNTYSYMNTTLNYKNIARAYRDEAVNASNSIKNYVIPTEATYNQDALETALNGVLTKIVDLQSQISVLKQPVDIQNLQNQIDEIKEVDIPKAINSIKPFNLIVETNCTKGTSYYGVITDYQLGDEYSIKASDTDVINSIGFFDERIDPVFGKVKTFAFTTDANNAGMSVIIVDRVRNGVKTTQTLIIHNS